jgi:hypothetical protein
MRRVDPVIHLQSVPTVGLLLCYNRHIHIQSAHLIWAPFGLFGHRLDYLGTVWTVWAPFGLFGHRLDCLGTVWTVWAPFGLFGHRLDCLGTVWTIWAPFGLFGHRLDCLGTCVARYKKIHKKLQFYSASCKAHTLGWTGQEGEDGIWNSWDVSGLKSYVQNKTFREIKNKPFQYLKHWKFLNTI